MDILGEAERATPAQSQSHPAPILLILLIIPLAGIFIALLHTYLDARQPIFQPAPQRAILDFRAPDFELPLLDGVTLVSPDDYAGRPLFLNFWATWCAPCVRELPALHEFINTHGADDNGPALLAINLGESADQIEPFLAGLGLADLPVALDINQVVKRDYGVQNLPTTYIIDGGGMARYKKLGELTYDEMAHYLKELKLAG